MSDQRAESLLRARLQRAVRPSVPTEGAHARVLQRLRDASEAGSAAGAWRMRLPRGFAAVLVGTAVAAVLGGAIGVAFALRHVQPTHPPAPVPAGHQMPTPIASPTPSPTLALQSCEGASISAAVSSSLGAAGHDGFDIKLHNEGNTACTLSGYAALTGELGAQPVALNVQHQAPSMFLNPHNVPGGTIPVGTVVLQPGGDAYIAIEYVTVNSDPRPCASLTKLLILIPGIQSHLTVDTTLDLGAVCAVNGGDPWLNESPITSAPFFQYH